MKDTRTDTLGAKLRHRVARVGIAILSMALSWSVIAGPIVIKINDLAYPNPPEVEVEGAPNGYNINTGDIVNNPSIEDGALITLFGVNNYYANPNAALPDWGGRFVDPNLPATAIRNSPDLVWVQHDLVDGDGPFFNGDLQVGFNSAFPGIWYFNPLYTGDDNLGPVSSKWVTVYSSSVVVIQFKGPGTAGKK